MPNASSTGSAAHGNISISQAVRDRFPDLLELILASESMNDEERQYWIDILPVMTAEQIDQLKDILQNEHDQLAAIDAKYADELQKEKQGRSATDIGEERKIQRESRMTEEHRSRAEEQSAVEDILKNIE
jgi:hypothetical protein